MGQIIGGAAKPKRCNLNKLSQLGTPAAGDHILVSSGNSMNAAGQGNFDRYIIGDGTTAAAALELRYLDDSTRPYIVQEVNRAVADIQPIEITGDVTNAPDEEDLTSENQGGTDVLKFKDKAYNSALYSGLGRTYLRKNIVNGYNVLTQAMVNAANTIYHIQYDYDLNGQTITLPAGCVLEFEGGSLSNGVITGNNTLLKNPCFDSVTFSGTFANKTLEISDKVFLTAPNLSNIISTFTNTQLILNSSYPSTKIDIASGLGGLNIIGNGNTLKLGQMVFANTANIYIDGVTFDCSEAAYTGSGDSGLIRIIGASANNNSVTIVNSKFTGYANYVLLYLRTLANIDIRHNTITSTGSGTTLASAIFLYNYLGVARVEDNIIDNIYGKGIGINQDINNTTTSLFILNNLIKDVEGAGIQAAGGVVYNGKICGNTIINANKSGNQSGSNGAAINLHGAIDTEIRNNFIKSTTYGTGIDIDGLYTSNGVSSTDRGVNITLANNRLSGKVSIAFVNVRDSVFVDNVVETSYVLSSSSSGVLSISGENVLVRGNYINSSDTVGRMVYINNTFAAHNIRIIENTFIKNNLVWLEVSAATSSSGSIYIMENICRKTEGSADIPTILDRTGKVLKRSGLEKHQIIRFNTHDGLDYSLAKAYKDGQFNEMILNVSVFGEGAATYSTEAITLQFKKQFGGSTSSKDIVTYPANTQFGSTVAKDVIATKYLLAFPVGYSINGYRITSQATADSIDLVLDLEYTTQDAIRYS